MRTPLTFQLSCLPFRVRAVDAKTAVDLGCAEGKLLKPLLQDKGFERLVGMDVSWRSLETAWRRLYLDQMPDAQRKRIELIHGLLMYRDKGLEGFDANSDRGHRASRPAAARRSSRLDRFRNIS